MSKGTIIYIGGFSLPDKNAAAHRVLSNGKILNKLGYNIVFIDVDNQLNFKKEGILSYKNVQNFDCWSTPYPKSSKQWITYLSSIEYFLKVLEKYSDVKAVICYNYQALAFMKIKSYCKKNNIKILADCTEWYSTKGNNLLFKIIKGFDSFLRMRIIQKKLDGVIVISRYLQKYYSAIKNVICIPPLVDLSEEKWKTSVNKSNNEGINIVYAGSPGKNKDSLNVIIEALSELKYVSNFVFNIMGMTKDQYLKEYKHHKELIKGLKERLVFHGRLSHTESLKWVKMADFSMFIRENSRMNNAGFPTKFAESISLGTPIVTNETSDLREFLVEGKNGFYLNTHNKELMISKLNIILTLDKNIIKEMKQNCNNSGMFHYEKYIKNFDVIIKEIG